jgi:hypothetical protein
MDGRFFNFPIVIDPFVRQSIQGHVFCGPETFLKVVERPTVFPDSEIERKTLKEGLVATGCYFCG